MQPEREVDELLRRSRRERDGADLDGHGGGTLHAQTPSTSSPRPAATSAPSSCAPPARPTSCPTSARSRGRRCPVVEMEGAERIMLGSNNYLGLTGDERVMQGARDALERYGTGLTGSRLLNGTIPLHLELEREIAEWMGTEDALVFTTGHQANVGTLGHDPRPRRHRHRRLAATTPRSSTAACSRARSCARSATTGSTSSSARSSARRATAAACSSSSTASSRWRATSRRCAEIAELCERARRAADGRRGPRRRRARRARRRHGGAARRRGPRRPADGHVLEVAGLLRRLRRRPGRGHRVPAHPVARLPLHRLRRSRPRSAPRWRRCGSCARTRARALLAAVLDNARYLRDGLEERGFAVVAARSR